MLGQGGGVCNTFVLARDLALGMPVVRFVGRTSRLLPTMEANTVSYQAKLHWTPRLSGAELEGTTGGRVLCSLVHSDSDSNFSASSKIISVPSSSASPSIN